MQGGSHKEKGLTRWGKISPTPVHTTHCSAYLRHPCCREKVKPKFFRLRGCVVYYLACNTGIHSNQTPPPPAFLPSRGSTHRRHVPEGAWGKKPASRLAGFPPHTSIPPFHNPLISPIALHTTHQSNQIIPPFHHCLLYTSPSPRD